MTAPHRSPVALIALVAALVAPAAAGGAQSTSPQDRDMGAAGDADAVVGAARAASATGARIDLDWRIRPLGGVPLRVADLAGRVVFLNVWATWCPPCVAELASVDRLRRSIDGDGVEFVLLSPEQEEPVSRFARRLPPGLPIFLEVDEVPASFGLDALPTTFIIDREGRLVLRHRGALDWDDDIVRAFLRELAGAEGAATSKPSPAAARGAAIVSGELLLPEGVAPGDTAPVALRLSIQPGWGVYWRYPGEAGLRAEATWSVGSGGSLVGTAWEAPVREEVDGAVVHYLRDDAVILGLIALEPASRADVPLSVTLRWAACRDVCISGETRLWGILSSAAGAAGTDRGSALREARARVPLPATASGFAARMEGRGILLERPSAAAADPGPLPSGPYTFFPYDHAVFDAAVIGQRAGKAGVLLPPATRARPGTPLRGVLVAAGPWDGDASPTRAIEVDVVLGAPPR